MHSIKFHETSTINGTSILVTPALVSVSEFTAHPLICHVQVCSRDLDCYDVCDRGTANPSPPHQTKKFPALLASIHNKLLDLVSTRAIYNPITAFTWARTTSAVETGNGPLHMWLRR
jgi:hypothetical protein